MSSDISVVCKDYRKSGQVFFFLMRLISNVLQKNTQGEKLSHVVQHYMSLENSDWHIFFVFLIILKSSLKYLYIFCR